MTLLDWITGYVLAGLVIYLIAVCAYIRDGELVPSLGRPWYMDLIINLCFVAVSPVPIAALLLRDTVKMVWDATTSIRHIFQKDCGTEEIVFGGIFIWLAWLTYNMGWDYALIGTFFLITALFLWQSAKAMQRLKDEKAAKAKELDRFQVGKAMAYFEIAEALSQMDSVNPSDIHDHGQELLAKARSKA